MRSSLNVLWLYVLLFLALLPVLFFAFYSGMLPTGIPRLGYGSIAAAATIGLLALPVALVFLAIAVLAAGRIRLKLKIKPVHYPWEDVFPEVPEYVDNLSGVDKGASSPLIAAHVAHKIVKPKVAPITPPSPPKAFKDETAIMRKARKEMWVLAIVAAIILFILLVRVTPGVKDMIFGQGSNATTANVTKPNLTAGTVLAAETQAKQFNATVNASRLNISAAFASVARKAKALPKSIFRSVNGVVGKAKRQLSRLASSAGSAVGKVPERAWQGAAVAVLVIVLAASVFYSYRARGLGQAVLWGKGWLGWLASFLVKPHPPFGRGASRARLELVFANRSEQKGFAAVFRAVKKNKLKLLIAAVVLAVVAAAAAAFIFRDWIRVMLPNIQAKLPNFPSLSNIGGAVSSFLSALSDFLTAYRLYIIMGIFALLVVIAFLFFLERRGKGGNA